VATERSSRRVLLIFLLASVVVVGIVFRPLGAALFVAAVLAAALWPIQRWLTRLLRGRKSLAAGLVVASVVLLLLAPLVSLSAFMVKEAVEGMRFVSETVRAQGVEGLVTKLPGWTEGLARKLLERIPMEPGAALDETVRRQVDVRGGAAASAVSTAFAATGSLVFQAAMMLIALFFLLTEKEAVLRWIGELSPLRRGQTDELLGEIRKVSGAVIRATMVTAAVQAIAATVGYLIARVPHPVFFGAITFFIAFIPAVGAASVSLVAAGLLLATGHPWAALFLAIWGLVVVGLVDNVVKPLLIRGGVALHGVVVFFALIGGLAAFGAIGLLIGPLAVTLFIALFRIYRRDYPVGPAVQPWETLLEPPQRLPPTAPPPHQHA
jgi:predicted PurR-regulated permease PerM